MCQSLYLVWSHNVSVTVPCVITYWCRFSLSLYLVWSHILLFSVTRHVRAGSFIVAVYLCRLFSIKFSETTRTEDQKCRCLRRARTTLSIRTFTTKTARLDLPGRRVTRTIRRRMSCCWLIGSGRTPVRTTGHSWMESWMPWASPHHKHKFYKKFIVSSKTAT